MADEDPLVVDAIAKLEDEDADAARTSPGVRIFGNVWGTRTNGTVRARPPARRVCKPRGTGFAVTGVSPRATR